MSITNLCLLKENDPFILVLKYFGIKWPLIFPYFSFNVHGLNNNVPFLIPDIDNCCLSFPFSWSVWSEVYQDHLLKEPVFGFIDLCFFFFLFSIASVSILYHFLSLAFTCSFEVGVEIINLEPFSQLKI